ncbi:hypothetical protein [Corynebacterium sp.]|uniref:hypothetical protein n=1 Tax=Corynebacterium sp. TaxID=1720 RepID=UPI0026DC5FF9|nr:hypothetical protein [Corynebacterium sp.]MDO5032247.1 hypothetical protein [Corynebacterium sp.]
MRCFVQANEKAPICDVDYADPPYVPQVGLPEWRANSVGFSESRGFYPSVKMGGEPVDYITLNAGEAVRIGDKDFLADKDGTFSVNYEGHHFKVAGGEYYSDTFPQKPDSTGKASPGTMCGEVTPSGNEHGWVYAAAEGTNCPAGLEAASQYAAGGSRLQGSWQCRTGVLEGWPKDSERRRMCTNGEQAVVIF